MGWIGPLFGQEPDCPSPNALGTETSPYLLKHACNPVNWVPWSNDVWQKAREQNKLVIISIGYFSCHWCQVMEKETFSDETVAKLMNENFINIKVDREERPDIDQVYMSAVQLMKGKGGWPLNIVAMPDQKPIYGGLYHSKDQWTGVLEKLILLRSENPEKTAQFSDELTVAIKDIYDLGADKTIIQIPKDSLNKAIDTLKNKWDLDTGGLQGDIKYMLPPHLNFCLDYLSLSNDQETRRYLKLTLDRLANGGIYDQVGGGFFRYSTDSLWNIPHFEKMLYDNAQMITVYAKAYRVFKDPLYKSLVYDIANFVESEMKSGQGGYISSINSDDANGEGGYYTWTPNELATLLGNDYGFFEHQYKILLFKNNKVHLKKRDSKAGDLLDPSIDSLSYLTEKWRSSLKTARLQRKKPAIDHKVIISWNALLMDAYIEAFKSFGDDHFLKLANALGALLIENISTNGKLPHIKSKISSTGFLDDYVYTALALFNLYSVSGKTVYLEYCNMLLQTVQKEFSRQNSVQTSYSSNNELISPVVITNDGVLPSPNALLARLYFLVSKIYVDKEMELLSKQLLGSMEQKLMTYPQSYTEWLRLAVSQHYPFYEIAIVGAQADEKARLMRSEGTFNAILLLSTTDSDIPLLQNKYDPARTWIYVCKESVCKLPVLNVTEALEILSSEK